MNPSDLSGFDPRVQLQIAQLSLDSSSSASQSSQSSQPSHSTTSHQYQHRPSRFVTYIHPRATSHPRHNQSYHQSAPPMPPGLDAFPPLGTEPVTYRDTQIQQTCQQSTMPAQAYVRGPAAQEFFNRSRGQGHGRGRGRGHRGQSPSQPDRNYQPPSAQSQNYVAPSDFHRPPPNRTQQATNYVGQRNYMSRENQQSWRQKLMLQADFLNFLISQSVTNSLSHDELKAKHTFRKRLERIAQDILVQCISNPDNLASTEMTLESYGSLSNSFGTAGCDVDLILLLRRGDQTYMEIPYNFQIRLEEALLAQGIGAKLLTNTHVPILQVCESPNPEVLANLRTRHAREAEMQYALEELEHAEGNRLGFDGLPLLSVEELKQADIAVQQLDTTAADVPLPDDPIIENINVEITGDCGIQCDINFTKRVAIHNTKLLWTYGQCDQRVRPIILFIKNWAKARDINTPYQGTLSSYGWVMLGLHYLMNIANPPVIPNLQHEAKASSWSTEMLEPFEGYEVAFVKDRTSIENIKATMPRNKESMGGLLQGFFRYYAQNSGFKWTQDVISIRTQGGLLSKQSKGWTALKRSEDRQNVRHRYLLAIEDPFETEHNVARTVGHNGVVAIRDELRRAWEIIDNVRRGQPGQDAWVWASRDNTIFGSGADLIDKAEKRGDLLRKDQEARREKLAEMKKLAEMQEELARKANLQSDLDNEEETSRNGTLNEEEHHDDSVDLIEDISQLIHNLHLQDEKVTRMRARVNSRQYVHYEDEKENEHNQIDQATHIPYHPNTIVETIDDDERDFAPDVGHAVQSPGNAEHDVNQYDQSEVYVNEVNYMVHPVSTIENSQSFAVVPDKKVRFANFEPQEQNTSHPVLTKLPKVGPYIAWTQSSVAGRWLRKRDKLIRNGVFRPDTCGEKGRLNATFRYDPDMTQEDLDAKNLVLEMHYRDGLHARIPESHQLVTMNTARAAIRDVQPIKAEIESPDSSPTGKPDDELLKEWPVTGTVWWSGFTSAGQWLLWRDRKISSGAWTPSRAGSQYVGEKLSELYPYDGEKTFADVERMNAELDVFFYNIEFPRIGMNPEERANWTAAMEQAIDKVHDHRRSRSAQVVGPTGIASQAPVEMRTGRDIPKEYPIDKISFHTDAHAQWTGANDVGRWLRKRDEKIIKGTWRSHVSDIFSEVDKIYPFDANRSLHEQDKLNHELETFCSNFVLPGHYDFTSNDKDLAYQAMLKIVEHRKSRDETRRVDVLLDVFKSQGQTDQSARTLSSNQPTKTSTTVDREIRAVQTLSQSLRNPSTDTTDFVRQQRLAFYSQPKKPIAVVNIKDTTEHGKADFHNQTHGAEGSCTRSQSTNCHISVSPPVNQPANEHQSTGSHSTETSVFCNRHEPVSTDDSEIVPNTLLQDTWRQQCHIRRDQDPRIMPIPRTLDFMFDPRQLADIETIRTGGNGCARGGLGNTLESDLHSWGGGGAMAQVSKKWSQGVDSDYRNGSWQVGDGGDPLLMRELPCISDFGA